MRGCLLAEESILFYSLSGGRMRTRASNIRTLIGVSDLEPTPWLGAVRLRACGAGLCGAASAEKSILLFNIRRFRAPRCPRRWEGARAQRRLRRRGKRRGSQEILSGRGGRGDAGERGNGSGSAGLDESAAPPQGGRGGACERGNGSGSAGFEPQRRLR